ncbi:MAG: twin-arginine translocation signal domain-containing protein, partial [Phaeodactylibacter sp.]|nr:twin-arginine translocation signal domain-containing protein [Phaeodactylibacter sp.]
MSDKINRRNFIQKSAAVGAGLAAIPGATFATPAVSKSGKPGTTLRIGVIGAGLRGQ